jgi:hypothetical protein
MLHPAWRNRPDQILDGLRFATSARPIREPAFAVLDSLQRYPPHVQVQAVFAAAAIMARALNKDPHELVSFARRQVTDIEAVESSASAISDYAKSELK